MLTHIWMGQDHEDGWFHFTIEHAYIVLSSCRNLVGCHILLSSTDGHLIPSANSQAHFPRVITLLHLGELFFIGAPAPKAFASCLKLPSLENLRVTQRLPYVPGTFIPTGWPQGEHDSVLLEFIRIYGPQLTFLWFDYQSLTQPALVKCLEGVPNIEELQIFATNQPEAFTPAKEYWVSATMGSQLVHRLTPGRVSGLGFDGTQEEVCLCPKLRQFACILGGADGGIGSTFLPSDGEWVH